MKRMTSSLLLFTLTNIPTFAFAQGSGDSAAWTSPGWVDYTLCGVALTMLAAAGVRLALMGATRLRLLAPQRAISLRTRLRLLFGTLIMTALLFPFLLSREPALAALLLSMAALSGLMAAGTQDASSPVLSAPEDL